MSEKLTHIDTLRNPNYIGSYELLIDDDKAIDLTVEITGVKKETVHNGKKEDEVITVHLKDHKPMILNTINRKALINLFGTAFIEKWTGRKFTLYVAKIIMDKRPTHALRIRPTLPGEPEAQTNKKAFGPSDARWNEAISAIRMGNTTVEELEKTRSLTPEDRAVLKKVQDDSQLI